jgi:pyrroline-5-carboxylate reductase
VLCSHGGSGSARDLVRELGGEAFDSNVEVADRADLVVRRAVTSPRGTTARGLAALERGGVRPVFQDAFDAVIDWFR